MHVATCLQCRKSVIPQSLAFSDAQCSVSKVYISARVPGVDNTNLARVGCTALKSTAASALRVTAASALKEAIVLPEETAKGSAQANPRNIIYYCIFTTV